MKKLAKLFSVLLVLMFAIVSFGCNQAETIIDKAEDIIDKAEDIKDKAEDIKDKAEDIKDKAEDIKDKGEDIVSSLTSEDTKDDSSTVSPAMDINSWIKVNTGEWEQTTEGIKVYGAGYREGHQGLQSKAMYNFEGTETRIKWQANGGSGAYSAFWVFLISDYVPETAENSGLVRGGYFTTDHSWKESVVIDVDTWYYTRIVVNPDSQYTAVTATGGYDDAGGSIIYEGTGEYENAHNGNIAVIFNDNYGGTETYIIVGEVITSASSTDSTTVPPTIIPTARPAATFTLEARDPRALAFDGENIWVATTGDSNVRKLDVSDGTVLGTYAVGENPYDLLFDGENIWVACYGNDSVTKLRASDGGILGTFAVGKRPVALAYDGENIWVANFGDNNVMKLRASDGTILHTYNIVSDGDPMAILYDGENIWVASHWGNISKLRTSDASQILGYKSSGNPAALAFDGENIWVALWHDAVVKKYQSHGVGLLDSYQVGLLPTDLCYDGSNIWVTNNGDDTVMRMSASDGAVLDTITVGDGPVALVYDGNNIWVANQRESTLMRLAAVN
ncbi:hypothetical protein ACFLX0_01075 [Chloroflexota bacterium]